jgi:lysophospholipase L1-like esterase
MKVMDATQPTQINPASSRWRSLLKAMLLGLLFWGTLALTWWLGTLLSGSPADFQLKSRLTDLGQLDMYRAANRGLRPDPDRVVFLGDSITYRWDLASSFASPKFVNRGIEGQTSGDMLVRFRQDVIDIQPKTVVILAGINDVRENFSNHGQDQDRMLAPFEANLETMAELAELHHIRPVFASLLPVHSYTPPGKAMRVDRWSSYIRTANQWLQRYCVTHQYLYIDYYSAMTDQNGMLRRELSTDGVHPNAEGYQVMTRAFSQAFLSGP